MSGRTRIALAGTVAALAATVSLLGGTLRDEEGADAASPVVAPALLQAGFGGGDTASLVARLRGADDARSLTLLGLAYQQRWRETADPGDLSRSEDALRRALRLAPKDAEATSALASLALSRHEFGKALSLGRRARALAPAAARNLGVVGDALVELGRYEEAFAAYDAFAARKPGLASYARVAHARELIGRPRLAIEAMELALDAAGGRPEPTAWARVELAKLHFGLGEPARAEQHLRAALSAFPGYVYALDALARVEAARGDDREAIALAREAVDAVPLPEFVGTLADLYRVAGRTREAREQDALVGAIERLLRSNGVRTELETAHFDVDHGVRLPQALDRARRAHRQRPSVEADDVLGWALARMGRCDEALRYSKRSLRLGTLDATKLFHRGMIERCLGRPARARVFFRRALDLNPHFSLMWAPVARRYAS